ncbi:hypothetical protein [Anaerobutyricum hallii]
MHVVGMIFQTCSKSFYYKL